MINYLEIVAVERVLKKINNDILWQEGYKEEFDIIKKALEYYLTDIRDTYADEQYSRMKDEGLDRI